MKIVKSATQKTYNIKTGKTAQWSAVCTHLLCHQSVECGKSTTSKMRNDSVEKCCKLPVADFPNSAFYHRPVYKRLAF